MSSQDTFFYSVVYGNMHIRITFCSSYYEYIFIQVIFPNIISFSARTFLRGTKSYKFPNEINLLNWCKYLFYLASQLCTNDSQNDERMN